jgi:hypothetical protein
MKRLSKTSKERLKSWINNWLLKSFNSKDWEIERIFVKCTNEKDSNF